MEKRQDEGSNKTLQDTFEPLGLITERIVTRLNAQKTNTFGEIELDTADAIVIIVVLRLHALPVLQSRIR